MYGLLLATAIGCGLIGGAFFVFSVMVMPALAKIPSDQGITAMQSINRVAITPGFMIPLFGTAILCAVVTVMSVARSDDAGSVLALVGCGLYLVGTIVLTMAYHVPRNNALDRLDAGESKSAAYWDTYLSQWTIANHVRGAAALAAAVLLILAIADIKTDDDDSAPAGEAATAVTDQPLPYGRVMISRR